MSQPINAHDIVGSHDILFISLDTLRYDVACKALELGETPYLASILPGGRWQECHSPGSFTYAAHHAFFAGFLPTPARSTMAQPSSAKAGPHHRLFAPRFVGSSSATETTYMFDAPDIVTGLRGEGYHTICIGGVGFFNKKTPLSCVLPALFDESHWREDLGVAEKAAPNNQVTLALQRLVDVPEQRRVFLFINIGACHQPNRIYVDGATEDSTETQRAALGYVDGTLAPLVSAMRRRAPLFVIVCSDHGTTYGEDGYHGHRLAHPAVWTVPYMEAVFTQEAGAS